jgi:hypothetical protein
MTPKAEHFKQHSAQRILAKPEKMEMQSRSVLASLSARSKNLFPTIHQGTAKSRFRECNGDFATVIVLGVVTRPHIARSGY